MILNLQMCVNLKFLIPLSEKVSNQQHFSAIKENLINKNQKNSIQNILQIS